MSAYPKALSYYISRVSNFSRNKIRLMTIANTTFNPNDQIVLELPQGLIDLSTFTLSGRLFTGVNGEANGQYAPFVEGMIDSINIEIGGVSIQNGFTNYNDLFNIYRQYQMADRYTFRQALQNENPISLTGTLSNFSCSNVPIACYNWLGFLGSVRILDTTCLPVTRVYIRLAPTSVLGIHSTGGVPNGGVRSYSWRNVNATVDVLDISDGVYYNMVSQRLAQAPLEIPFDNFQTISGTFASTNQTTRWSTSTDCLTDVIATIKSSGFDSNLATTGATTSLPNYFNRGGDPANVVVNTSQFSVNGIRYPTIPCQNADGEVFTHTAHTMGVSQETLGASDVTLSSLSNFNRVSWVHANSFSYPDEHDDHKLIGLSGKGSSILGTFETTGSGNCLPIVWLKSKSVLRIGQGKQVELVL